MLVIQNEDTPACLGTKLRCSEQGVATLTVAPLFKGRRGGAYKENLASLARLARLGVGFCRFSDAHRTGSSDMLHSTVATADLSICHALQYLASQVQSVPTNAPHRTAGIQREPREPQHGQTAIFARPSVDQRADKLFSL